MDIKKYLRSDQFGEGARLIVLAVIICLAIGVYHVYTSLHPAPYTVSNYGFEINFPGTPTVSQLATLNTGSGGTESGAIYAVQNTSKKTNYAVYVTRYTNINFSKLSKNYTVGTLQSEIEALARHNNSSISDGKTIRFDNMYAVKATLTPSQKSYSKTYVLALMKTHDLYVILGSGIPISNFNTFANTFHFL